jgi:hypothetical protein
MNPILGALIIVMLTLALSALVAIVIIVFRVK